MIGIGAVTAPVTFAVAEKVSAPVTGLIGEGAAAWTPAQLSGLALWLDADDSDTITLNGTDVSQWDDKSGNGYHASQAVAAAQPLYVASGLNGKGSVEFDGVNALMPISFTDANSAPITLILAGRLDVVIQTSYIIDFENQRRVFTTSGDIFDGAWSFASNSTTGNMLLQFSASTAEGNEVYRNGVRISPARSGSDSFSTGIVMLGGRHTNSTQNFDGLMSEIVMVRAVLSVSDRQKLEGYLAWKWGLSYALPANHPYRWDTSLFGGTDLSGFDADAKTYIASVETADEQDLETGVRTAINDFVVGCKADGIWTAIKASCILAGARTLTGALTPLVGTGPTNFNFVSGDYNRKTGLVGDGSTKYLDSNRNNNADPQDSKHLAIYQSSITTASALLLATTNTSGRSALISFVPGGISSRINSQTVTANNGDAIGFVGGVRTSSTATSARVGGTDFPETVTSESPANLSIGVFASADGQALTDARITFYSIGEALSLAQLDTRVSALMTAIDGAIP